MNRVSPLLLAVCIAAAPSALHADDADASVKVTLSGSHASMLRQNRIAKEEAYSFLRYPNQVLRFVDDGYLIELPGNEDYRVLAGYPYARPAVRSFVERLADRYVDACGERLVVTSLTRPTTRQPGNASPLSVHPAGMAVDLRVSALSSCRNWLGTELLSLEANGLVDGTREFRPPHFHVAVFPEQYAVYDDSMRIVEAAAAQDALRAAKALEATQRAAWAAAAQVVMPVAPQAAPHMSILLQIALLVARTLLPV